MKWYKRAITLVVTFSIVLSSIGNIIVNAEDDDNIVSMLSSENYSNFQEYNKDSTNNSISETMNDCQLLKYIDTDQFKESNFVCRDILSEDLNTYAFIDECGNKVVYIMDENTKYIDSYGNIVEKNLTLVPVEKGLRVLENDINLIMPYNISNGVSLDYMDYNLTIIPGSINDEVSFEEHDNSVIYNSVFDKSTSLQYIPLLSGVKENIIISEYNEESSFDFTIKTNGLSAFNIGEKWHFSLEEDAELKFTIGSVEIYDAVGKLGLGHLEVEETNNEFEYIIHIIPDYDFLLNENTVYPVTIDPTITVSDNTHGVNSIIDAPVFAGYPNSNFGGYEYNRIGTPSSNYGVGRTAVKLSGLTNTSDYQNMIAAQITDVKFYVREGIGGGTQNINVYPLINTSWTETGVTWNNIGSYDVSYNYGASMANNQWTSFNITNLVKDWKNNIFSADAGFILINSNENNDECFCSSEHFTTSFRPYVVVTYNSSVSGGGDSFDNAFAMSLNTPVTLNIVNSNGKKYFSFTPQNTDFYSFESSAIISGDPCGALYNPYQVELVDNDDYNGTNFKITYHLISGMKYYFVASCFSGGIGSYNVTVYEETNPTIISAMTTNISVEHNYLVSNSTAYKPTYCKFIAPVTGEYLFYSFSQSSDPRLWIYSDTFDQLGTNDDAAGNHNFRLSLDLCEGQTYYLVAGHYLANIGYYSFGVGMAVNIPTDDYHIKNIGSELNVDIHGPGAQEWVHQWSFHADDQEKWLIQKQIDGYYTIRSEFGLNKYIGVSNYLVGMDNVKLYSSISDDTKWKIFTTFDGNLFFEPKNGEGMVLYAPDSILGTELQLEYMSYTASNRNKWIFEVKPSTILEGQRWCRWCWAASSRMLVNNYFAIPDVRTQNEAVKAVKGSVVNEPATIGETANAGKYYRSASTSINELNLTTGVWNIYSESTLKKFFDDGHVVCILRGWYPDGARDGGHFTAIVGYTTIFINGNLQHRFIVYDPWPNPEPSSWTAPVITDGQIKTVSYQWICNGQNAQSVMDSDVDTGRWEGFVVVQTNYSNDVISWSD